MNILLLGAPGVGKGTQAERLSKKLKIPVISIGNILREIVKSENELAKKIKGYMEAGELVPDYIVVDILQDRLKKSDCENGYILDGFPRNKAQAICLDDMGVYLDKVVEIHVEDEIILRRLLGRRVCKNCGESYHIEHKKPKVEGVCDVCKGELIVRKDDSKDTIENRLKVFREETKPLEKYYTGDGRFFVVNGEGNIKEVSELVISVLGE